MKITVTVLIAAFLAGCATTQESDWHWYKAGATQQDFESDDGQCRAQAFSVPGGNLFQIAMVLHSCMQGKGWQKRANK